jgi:hexosaminidase
MRLGTLVVAMCAWSLAARGVSAAPVTHDLMPAPAGLEWGQGRLVLGKRALAAIAGGCDERAERAVMRLGERLASSGVRMEVAGDGPAAVVLECREPGPAVQSVEDDEAYVLTVTAQQARVTAATTLGVIRGLATLEQLVRREASRVVLPAVTIRDAPRFHWRGLLIDVCRHWQPIEVLKRNLDAMAAVKLNVLHWHLTEDQGFRIESQRFPKLHGRGSDGLYYTQAQAREVIAYARDRGIRVVPEFDVPGHATSWLVGYPELGSAPGPFELIRTWGIFDNCLDPTRDAVYAFLDGFFGEMAALFPDRYMHIGGDEVTPRQWNENTAIQVFAFDKGLRGAYDLQTHFNHRVSEIVARHGKVMVGWDEVLDPALPRTTVVQSWRGPKSLADAARLGFPCILSRGFYLDHMLPASEHYLVDPVPETEGLTSAEQARVLGGEAAMWSEFVTPENIDSRIWPRGAAIAERLWSPREIRDVADMYRRLEIASARLSGLGVTHLSNEEAVLRRLAGDQPTEPLRRLVELVTPVKLYARGASRSYTSRTPLDRLVDAARPESEPARRFGEALDQALAAAPDFTDLERLRPTLSSWRDNHETLGPVLSASPRTVEALSLSRDLSALGTLGLQAIDLLVARREASPEWRQEAQALLEGAAIPRAEVELAVVPPMRKLVAAAGGR